MGEQMRELQKLKEVREQLIVQTSLNAIADGIEDKAREISDMREGRTHWRKDVINFLASVMQTAAAGKLTVPDFSQRAGAEQRVMLFVGTHWMVIDKQEYLDFVKACCKKMGLRELELEDPGFMLQVCETFAFRISRSQKHYVPSDQALVNLQNGTLVLSADGMSTLRDHDPNDYLTYCLPYAYDTNAECPKWLAFLDQMLPEKEAQTVLAEYIAYGFTKGLKIEKMLVFFGSGSNGKSVVLDMITALVGRSNISNVSLDSLTNDDVKRTMCEHKMFNVSHESNRDLDPSVLKLLVSGEPVEVRTLYVGSRTMYDYGKLITSFNVLPRAENTHGFHRRFIIMPFNTVIAEKDIDVDLAKKLCEELPGILNWVLAAMPGLMQRRAFTESPVCKEALYKYRLHSDSVLLFFTTCCEFGNVTISGKDIFNLYRGFCANQAVHALGKQNFYERLEKISGVEREEKSRVTNFNIKIVDYESCQY